MAKVIIAAGSNLGNRIDYIQKAGTFLAELSDVTAEKSSVWESDPVGPAEYKFLNSVSIIETELTPPKLLSGLKLFEQKLGREINPRKWGPRVLDLDIIAYNSLVIQMESLIIPHPEYHLRRFVLLPLQELSPGWIDPRTEMPIRVMIDKAPEIEIYKTEQKW